MKGTNLEVTLGEKYIADKLPKSKSTVFLESRGYLREALSNLFEIEPLEIPIQANPGKPPKLPLGMGYLSISHTIDALVIIWDINKVGIDMERMDRNFNYKSLAKNVFKKKIDEKYYNNRKKDILKRWCSLEAAIKWERGSIFRDIYNWDYFDNNKKIIHKTKNYKVNVFQINFYDWIIAFCSERKILNSSIVCSEF